MNLMIKNVDNQNERTTKIRKNKNRSNNGSVAGKATMIGLLPFTKNEQRRSRTGHAYTIQEHTKVQDRVNPLS